MAPRIAIIGGGSYQWTPKLIVDLANTPSLHDAEVVIEDIDPEPIPRMVELVEHVAKRRGIGLSATGTTDQRAALDGADYVVVCISTGGLDSMAFDIEIPARYGIRQPVGDTVGPGGIMRALRNVPVLVGIAREMEEICPDAWLLNLTNPMTTLCRAVTKETSITTIGLCHEITGTHVMLALLLEVGFLDLDLTITGVNHFPVITAVGAAGEDGLARLADLLAREDEIANQPLDSGLPALLGYVKHSPGAGWTKGDLLANHRVKFELFRRFGALPGAGDRHLVEFFPGFVTEDSGWGRRWGVELTSIDDRRAWLARDVAALDRLLAADEVSPWPSGEMVAPVVDCRLRDLRGHFPLNLPNRGQCPDLPPDVVVESICAVDSGGARGRDTAQAPPFFTEQLRRVSAAQELTVEAALRGDRGKVFEAMLADPLASRTEFDALARMTDEMLAATARRRPGFAWASPTGRTHPATHDQP